MPGSQTSPTASIGLLLMRIGAGALLIYGHGWPKLMHYTERAGRFSDPLHIGSDRSLMLTIFAEFVCAAAVVLGFATRFAAGVIVILFAVILGVVTRGEPFSEREMAMIYCLPFLCLVFTGGGNYALDARWGPKVKFGS
jgi:putative oxidoreductase